CVRSYCVADFAAPREPGSAMLSGFRVSQIHFPAAPPTLELRSPAHEDDLGAGLILHPGEHLSPIVDPLNGLRLSRRALYRIAVLVQLELLQLGVWQLVSVQDRYS